MLGNMQDFEKFLLPISKTCRARNPYIASNKMCAQIWVTNRQFAGRFVE